MCRLIEIARAVADSLSDVNAEIRYTPEYSLSDIASRRVVVVPTGTEFKHVGRASTEETHSISIGVIVRCRENQTGSLIDFCAGLVGRLLYAKFAGATCIGAAFNPLYSPETIRENSQFTCVLELRFRVTVDGLQS